MSHDHLKNDINHRCRSITLYKIYTLDNAYYSAVINVKNPNTTPNAFGIINI